MSASSQRVTDVCRPARSLRIGIVCDGAIVQTSHVEVESPLSVGLAGVVSQGPVRIVPTVQGPLLMVGRDLSGRLGRGGRVRPLAEWVEVVGNRQGVILRVGDRLRVTVPGGLVLVQGMPREAVGSVVSGGFRPLLIQRGDGPFLGLLSSCASAAMALLVVAAGIEPVDSLARVECPERVMQVLMRPPVPPAPEPEPTPPEPASEDKTVAAAQPAMEPEPEPLEDAVADPETKKRRLIKRVAMLGGLDQIERMLSDPGDESALREALDRTSGPDIIAAKGGEKRRCRG